MRPHAANSADCLSNKFNSTILPLSSPRCSLSIATAFRFDSIVVRNFIYYSFAKVHIFFSSVSRFLIGHLCSYNGNTEDEKGSHRNRNNIGYFVFIFDSSFVVDVPMSSKCGAHLLPNKECIRHKEMTIEL